jgi:Family of unknown function (DUF5335)
MSEHPHELPRSEWHPYLQAVTAEHEGDEVTIELVDRELGDEREVERLPLAYLDYEPDDDAVIVAVGGRDRRYPVVLHHFVDGPHRILADSYEPGPTLALDIMDDEGGHTIVTLHKPGS